MENKNETLGDGLEQEIARVKELCKVYEEIILNAAIGLALIRRRLSRAEKAHADQDLTAMCQAYQDLEGCQ